MNHDQTYEENRDEFIARLMMAGWPKEEAAAEWYKIQNDEEGTP